MGIEDPSSFLCTEQKENSNSSEYYYFQQTYKGVAIINAGFGVYAYREDGKPMAVEGYYLRGLDMDVEPQITEKEARKAVPLEKHTKITQSRLAVMEVPERGSRLIWQFFVDANSIQKQKYVFIDAVTGEFLQETYFAEPLRELLPSTQADLL